MATLKTIGIVVVAALAASAAGWLPALEITATRRHSHVLAFEITRFFTEPFKKRGGLALGRTGRHTADKADYRHGRLLAAASSGARRRAKVRQSGEVDPGGEGCAAEKRSRAAQRDSGLVRECGRAWSLRREKVVRELESREPAAASSGARRRAKVRTVIER